MYAYLSILYIYIFHKLSLANTQHACFPRARCLGPSWAKLEPIHIRGAKFQHNSFNASGSSTTLSFILKPLLHWPFLHGTLGTAFSCVFHMSLYSQVFLHRSARFCFVFTDFTVRSLFATRSCTQRYRACTWRSFPRPRLAAVPLAADESLRTIRSYFRPQSAISGFRLSPSAAPRVST